MRSGSILIASGWGFDGCGLKPHSGTFADRQICHVQWKVPVQKQQHPFETFPALIAGTCRIILHGCDSGARLLCQPLLLLAPPDTPYLPFAPAHDGYPFLNPAT